MEFEWDEGKSDACYSERGFDFSYVIAAFFDNNRLIRHDKRWDYGVNAISCWAKSKAACFL